MAVLCLLAPLATACGTTPPGPGNAGAGARSSADPPGTAPPGTAPPGTAPASADPAKVRTDRQPITRRFTALGDFESVRWLGGAHGASRSPDRFPGPTDYWIEAIVRLRAGDLTGLRTRHDWVPTTAPTARPALRAALPATGRWVTGPGPTEEILATSGMSGEVRVHPATRTVYVSAGTR